MDQLRLMWLVFVCNIDILQLTEYQLVFVCNIDILRLTGYQLVFVYNIDNLQRTEKLDSSELIDHINKLSHFLQNV